MIRPHFRSILATGSALAAALSKLWSGKPAAPSAPLLRNEDRPRYRSHRPARPKVGNAARRLNRFRSEYGDHELSGWRAWRKAVES
jgi:hypothetical protein